MNPPPDAVVGDPVTIAPPAGAVVDVSTGAATIDLRDRSREGATTRTPSPAPSPPGPAPQAAGRVITGHRVRVVTVLLACIVGLYAAQEALWPHHSAPSGTVERVWAAASVIWLVGVVPSAFGLAGLLMYRSRDADIAPRAFSNVVSFRVVSRGDNRDTLEQTVQRIRVEMWQTPIFRYVIEVVTDEPVALDPAHDLVHYLVPSEYATPSGARFKARALQYVLETSALPPNGWIVHLDEETQPTPSGIRGIARMIHEEESSGRPRIGQGAILYHRQWANHPLLTLADVQRTGDDLGRFHLQQRLGKMLFGLHGSFIVVRNDVEKEIGFDFGPAGSITEDAYFALVAMDRGHRSRWVDGFLEEQSCKTYQDLIQQRRRWFRGLWATVVNAPVARRRSLTLMAFVLLWAFAPLSAAYTVLHLFASSFEVAPWLRFLANASFAVYLTTSIVGLHANLAEYARFSRPRRALAYAALVVCFPFFSILECAGVVMGVVERGGGFHVVEK